MQTHVSKVRAAIGGPCWGWLLGPKLCIQGSAGCPEAARRQRPQVAGTTSSPACQEADNGPDGAGRLPRQRMLDPYADPAARRSLSTSDRATGGPGSDFGLFRNLQGVIYFDAQVPHGGLESMY